MTNNASLYAAIMDDSIYFVDVVFHNSSTRYTYKCDIPGMKVGDIVVVDTAKYAVARVVNVHSDIPLDKENIEFRWVVGHVDVDTHQRRLAAEKALVRQVQNMRAKAILQRVLQEMGIPHDSATRIRLSYDKVDDNVTDDSTDDTILDVDEDDFEYDPDEYADEHGGN